jgi:hypothetical protein
MTVSLYAYTTLTLLLVFLVLLVMRRAFYVLGLGFWASGGRLTELFKGVQLLDILQMEIFLVFSRARMLLSHCFCPHIPSRLQHIDLPIVPSHHVTLF